MMITAKQISALLGITERDAHKKIVVCKERAIGNNLMQLDEVLLDYHSKSIGIKVISKYLGIDFVGALADVQKNYLKKKQTRDYIYYVFPESKRNQKPGHTKPTLKIPPKLASLLTGKQQDNIKSHWSITYGDLVTIV